MLYQYASPRQRELYLSGIVAGEISPSFAMTEPDVVSSDPIQLQVGRGHRDRRPRRMHRSLSIVRSRRRGTHARLCVDAMRP